MTYAHSGGDLMLLGPLSREHRLNPTEALGLLDAHRQEYRMHHTAGDMPMTTEALGLFSQLHAAIEDKRRWDRASK